MNVNPVPSDFEARTNTTYAALMWALARPGLPRDQFSAGLAGIIEALIDRECSVYCDDRNLLEVAARTGAELVTPENADHLFFDMLPGKDLLKQIALGSDLYPETGATLVCNAKLGQGQNLHLTGPGCNGVVDVQVGGLPDGFWQMRAQVMRYPMGFELFLVDGLRVLGVPRSTQVEVL